MTEITPETPTEMTADDPAWKARLPQFTWAGVSIIFLVYVLFGSVETRIWTYGRLSFQRRGIAHVWRYFGDHLPDMPGGPLFPFLYYASLAVLVVGTVVGLGLFLLSGEDVPSTPADRVGPGSLADE